MRQLTNEQKIFGALIVKNPEKVQRMREQLSSVLIEGLSEDFRATYNLAMIRINKLCQEHPLCPNCERINKLEKRVNVVKKNFDEEHILFLRKEKGMSIRAIQLETGLSYQTLYYFFQKKGLNKLKRVETGLINHNNTKMFFENKMTDLELQKKQIEMRIEILKEVLNENRNIKRSFE